MKKQEYLKLLYILILVVGAVLLLDFFFSSKEPPKLEVIMFEPNRAEDAQRFFIDLDIDAKSFIVFDNSEDKIIYEKDSETLYPIASIAKLFVALVSNEYITKEDVTTIGEQDFNKYSRADIKIGERWNTEDLLKYTLITSSNVGSSAVARTVARKTSRKFEDIAEEKLKEFSLNQSFIINPTGLDIHDNFASAQATAREIVDAGYLLLTKYPNLANATTKPIESFVTLDGGFKEAKNTNFDFTENENVLLSKTGFTDIAGGNLLVIFEVANRPITILVLGSLNKTTRVSDVEKLLEATKRYYEKPVIKQYE